MSHFSLLLGYGDADPNAIELNDRSTIWLKPGGLQLSEPDTTQDRRDLVMSFYVRRDTGAHALTLLSTLAGWAEGADERESGRVAPLTLKVSGSDVVTTWFDIKAISLVIPPDVWSTTRQQQYADGVQIALECTAHGRTTSTSAITDQIVYPNDPTITVPALSSDAPALLTLDVDDLSREGTGLAQLRASAMALPAVATVPEHTLRFTTPDTQAVTSANVTISSGASVYNGTSSTATTDAGVLDETQAWMAVRVNPTTLGGPLIVWGDDGNNLIYLYTDAGGGIVGGRVNVR